MGDNYISVPPGALYAAEFGPETAAVLRKNTLKGGRVATLHSDRGAAGVFSLNSIFARREMFVKIDSMSMRATVHDAVGGGDNTSTASAEPTPRDRIDEDEERLPAWLSVPQRSCFAPTSVVKADSRSVA